MTAKKLKQLIFFLIFILTIITFTIGYRYYQDNKQDTKYQSVHTNHLKTLIDKNNPQINAIHQYLEQVNFNGTAAVFERGQLKLNKGYGFKNFETEEKNRADTLYLIGSSQKFTTGLMLKQLENEQKININNTVNQYLPWFKTSKPITLNQLMLHQSGLYKYKASTSYKNLDSAVQSIQQRGIEPKFYNKNRYNDANYLVLSRVIEEVTG
ncbi:MAG: serine hydrolase domain-containing protein, partial [Staphylococcus equorum]